MWWLKAVAVVLGFASVLLVWKDNMREQPDPEREARRAAEQRERIDKCLKLPGEVDMTIDSFGDFAGCTVKVKSK